MVARMYSFIVLIFSGVTLLSCTDLIFDVLLQATGYFPPGSERVGLVEIFDSDGSQMQDWLR